MRFKIWGLAGAGLLLICTPAAAHHSAAMFDTTKTVSLTGTVREFQWTNPHSWLQLLISDGREAPREWSLEMSNPSALMRKGWTKSSIKAGDKIVAVIHPMQSGSPGGELISITREDGTEIGKQ